MGKATAMGKNSVNGKTFLEKRYSEDLELEDAVHTAILTLKEGFEGQMTEDNIEIGICNADGFRRLSPQEVRTTWRTFSRHLRRQNQRFNSSAMDDILVKQKLC